MTRCKTRFFYSGRAEYVLTECDDGELRLSRLLRFDNTDYHWASKLPEGQGIWGIAIGTEFVAEYYPCCEIEDYDCELERYTDEIQKVADELHRMDTMDGLRPSTDFSEP